MDALTSTSTSSHNATTQTDEGVESEEGSASESPPPIGSPIQSSRCDYYTIPSAGELAELVDVDGNMFVSNGFTVGRTGYGSVFWPGETNVAGLSLDRLVHFRHKEVVVYPEESDKPPIGDGLNKPAEITLERVWPNDKSTRLPIKELERLEKMKFRERLEKAAADMGAVFKDYRPDSGSWVFKVSHFSKYGLFEDDEEGAPSNAELNQSKNDAVNQHAVQKEQIVQTRKELVQKSTANSINTGVIGLGGGSVTEQTVVFMDTTNTTSNFPMKDSLFYSAGGDEELGDSVKRVMEATGKAVSLIKKAGLFGGSEKVEEKYERPRKFSDLAGEFSRLEESLFRSGEEEEELAVAPQQLCQLPPTPNRVNTLRIVPLKESVLFKREHLNWDVGLKMGRSFRAGASPTSPYQFCRPIVMGQDALDSSSFLEMSSSRERREQSKKVALCCTEDGFSRPPRDLLEELCRTAVEFSHPASDRDWSDKCRFLPPDSSEAEAYLSAVSKVTGDRLGDYPWELCKALFEGGYADAVSRVSDWLSRKIEFDQKSVPKPAAVASGDRNCEAAAIFYDKLTCGQLESAVLEAFDNGDLRLALLLSMRGSNECRSLCLEQLAQWKKFGEERFVDRHRFLIFMIMAQQATWSRGDELLNCCEGLDWKRAFGLCLWYGIGGGDRDLCEVVESYERLVELRIAAAPEFKNGKNDVIFELLKLYADRSHSLAAVLEPAGHGAVNDDYHSSWYLWSVLYSFGYHHLPARSECLLHKRYAEQLASAKLFPYAVFVLQHIADENEREAAVKGMLCRLVAGEESVEQHIRFVVNVLKIPEKWLAEAKALKCLDEKNFKLAALFAAEAEQLNLAHRLFLQHVAPVAIVNEFFSILSELIGRLDAASDRIVGWPTGGQIYADFLYIRQSIADFAERCDEQEEQEFTAALLERVKRLAAALTGMDCRTPIQRLAQGEVARQATGLLRTLLSAEDRLKMTPEIMQLPMPDNYAMEEAHSVLRLYLDQQENINL